MHSLCDVVSFNILNTRILQVYGKTFVTWLYNKAFFMVYGFLYNKGHFFSTLVLVFLVCSQWNLVCSVVNVMNINLEYLPVLWFRLNRTGLLVYWVLEKLNYCTCTYSSVARFVYFVTLTVMCCVLQWKPSELKLPNLMLKIV